jgi:hypothetical protein
VLFCLVLCIEFDRSEVVVLFLFLLQVVFFSINFVAFGI